MLFAFDYEHVAVDPKTNAIAARINEELKSASAHYTHTHTQPTDPFVCKSKALDRVNDPPVRPNTDSYANGK
ncbi:MAG: hypothetical protein RJB11_2083 [Planctomycetota bacterium]